MRSVSELLVCFVCIFSIVYGQENNVCPTFKDYYTIKNNSRCWYDLAAEYSAPEIIQRMGYPLRTYKVQTADGYILTMFRIPNDHKKNPDAKYTPIYLQHGLVATCATFLGKGKDSLAFVLSDAGYDVWLGNYRGNPYSEEHINMTVYDQEYWNHGLDEISLLDIPANFQTILTHTAPGSKIIFIGHSLGTSVSLMFASEYPERARDIVKMMVLLCPAYTLSNMVSPYKMAAPMGDFILDSVRRLRLDRIVSHARELRRLVVPVCMESPELMQNCMQMYNLFYGPKTDLGPESIPVYFNQLPGGTSIKILNHAADLVKGNFRKYNFNELNYRVYGTHYPPKYDISKILVPVYLVYSAQDWATPEAACEIPSSRAEYSHYVCTDDGEVKCLPGWTGDLCDVPKCRSGCDPLQGYCNRPGECLCKLGYYGEKCNKCIPLPGCQRGYCNVSFECVCHEGWDGIFCTEPICGPECHSTRGYCDAPGQCQCRIGWSGRTCKECQVLPGCVHGYCEKPLECKCNPGYTGILCQTPICKASCHKERGYCRKPGECRCKIGWWGMNCEKCYPYPGCLNGSCRRPWECNCKKGWGGMLCDEELNHCEKHSDICQNGAKCISVVEDEGSYRCLCREGTSGRNCEHSEIHTKKPVTVKPITSTTNNSETGAESSTDANVIVAENVTTTEKIEVVVEENET